MQIAANQKQFEAEKKNWSKEKESLHEVIKSLREQLANKQKSEAEYVYIECINYHISPKHLDVQLYN